MEYLLPIGVILTAIILTVGGGLIKYDGGHENIGRWVWCWLTILATACLWAVIFTIILLC